MVVLIPDDTRANLISMAHAGGLYGNAPIGGGFWGDVGKGLKQAGKWAFNNVIKPIGEPLLKSAVGELTHLGQQGIGALSQAGMGAITGATVGGGLSTRIGGGLPRRGVSKFITPN